MREILFRGRNVKANVWEYGDLIRNASGKTFIRKNYQDVDIFEEVCPETVGQYTGLKDRGEYKIFEGDILQNPDDAALLKVEWSEDEASFYAYEIDGCWCYGANEMVCFNVVGNKWDDPELLREMDKGE